IKTDDALAVSGLYASLNVGYQSAARKFTCIAGLLAVGYPFPARRNFLTDFPVSYWWRIRRCRLRSTPVRSSLFWIKPVQAMGRSFPLQRIGGTSGFTS